MATYRHGLPAVMDRTMVTDAGLETWLVFQQGIELPHFAAFTLLKSEPGTELLRRWFRRFAEIAAESGHGLLLESPTWRANPDWGRRLGYDTLALADANRSAIDLLLRVRTDSECRARPVVVSGTLGPRGDGYVPDGRMSVAEAEAYHRQQIATFAGTDADLVSALTINCVDEAVGIARAARKERMPVVLSFTVETDGRLPSGERLPEAIERTDEATDGHVLHYMINCAHPSHFAQVLQDTGPWRERVRGLRANASRKSHAELDVATELDDGDPDELAGRYVELRSVLPRLCVIGGCCGTDHRHVLAMARSFSG